MEKKLQILKEGQEGYGILLESDSGFIDVKNRFNEKILKEAIDNQTNFYDNPIVHCVLQRYGVPNKNKRIYPEKFLRGSVDKYMGNVKQRSAIGETDHADSTNVSLMNVGLLIQDIYWEGSACMGVVLLPITDGFKNMGICSNSADLVANLLIKHKILTGISSRSIGTVKKNGRWDEVQSDLEILCWDHVSVPSTPLAYLHTDKEAAEAAIPYSDPQFEAEKKSNPMNDKLKRFLGRF